MGDDEFKKRVASLAGGEYKPVSKYITARKIILMKHNKCGKVWQTTPDRFLRGHGAQFAKKATVRKQLQNIYLHIILILSDKRNLKTVDLNTCYRLISIYQN